MNKKSFSKQESANFLNVSVSAFEKWLAKFDLHPAQILPNGKKFYSQEQLDELRISITNGTGSEFTNGTGSELNFTNGAGEQIAAETISRINGIEPSILLLRGIVSAGSKHNSKHNPNGGFICPSCGSDTMTCQRLNYGFQWHCDNCGDKDNVALFASHYGFRDLKETCIKACKELAIPCLFNDTSIDKKPPDITTSSSSVSSAYHYSDSSRQALDDAKFAIKSIPPEQLGVDILSPAKGGSWICPNPDCRDGSGSDGTGMTHYTKPDGTHEFYCGKCAKAYDNIDILAFYFGLDSNCQFRDIIERSASLFNLAALSSSRSDFKPVEPKPGVPNKFKKLILNAHNRLKLFIDNLGGIWRGLTFDTLDKFYVGYTENWWARSGAPTTPRVIIPTSFSHYLARLVGKITDFDVPDNVHLDEKEHRGQKEIFNFKRALIQSQNPIVFIVEGEIDVMSIFQASNGSINVVAISGSSLATSIERQFKSLPSKKNFVVLFDNDDTGREKAPILATKLKALGHKAIVQLLSDNFNDANDFLQADPDGLATRLQTLYSDVQAQFDSLPDTTQIPAPTTNLSASTAIDDFELELLSWKDSFGFISPKIIPDLRAANAFFDDLNPLDISLSDIIGNRGKYFAALFSYYFPERATKFLDTVKAAKKLAKLALNAIAADTKNRSELGEIIPVVDISDLAKLADVIPHELKAAIKSLANGVKKNHRQSAVQRHCDEINSSRLAEEKKYSDNPPSTRQFVSDCPIDLVLPQGVKFYDSGIICVDYDKPANRFGGRPEVQATAMPIVPTKILREHGKGVTWYEIAIKTSQNTWRRAIVSGDTLNPRKIFELANFGALITNPNIFARFLAQIIAINNGKIGETTCYTQPGWVDKTFKKFAYPGVSDEGYIVRRDGFNYEKEFATSGDPDLWKNTFCKVCQNGDWLACCFIGTSLAAPLLRPLNLPNLQFHLVGEPNCGKSGIEKIAASVFGNPIEIIRSFGATLKNRIAVACAYRDMPTFLDELGTLQGGKKGEETLPDMIYEFFMGKANQAQKRDGSSRETVNFYGTRVSTAERAILKSHDAQGTYKRLLELRCEKAFFDEDFASRLHSITENNYGHFGRIWINFIIEHLDEIKATYAEFIKLFDELAPLIRFKQNIEHTLIKTVVGSLLAYHFFCVAIGIQSEFNWGDFIEQCEFALDEIPTKSETNEAQRALADLQSFIDSNLTRFIYSVHTELPCNEKLFARTPHEYVPNQSPWFGKFLSDGAVAFFPTVLRDILVNQLGFASADSILKIWADRGILATTKGRGLRFYTRVCGKTIPTYCLASSSFDRADLAMKEKIPPNDESPWDD